MTPDGMGTLVTLRFGIAPSDTGELRPMDVPAVVVPLSPSPKHGDGISEIPEEEDEDEEPVRVLSHAIAGKETMTSGWFSTLKPSTTPIQHRRSSTPDPMEEYQKYAQEIGDTGESETEIKETKTKPDLTSPKGEVELGEYVLIDIPDQNGTKSSTPAEAQSLPPSTKPDIRLSSEYAIVRAPSTDPQNDPMKENKAKSCCIIS
eukprot:TRINITY_DN23627_c0_g1_i1.p1 TRINITY_DN23627_c0_g1~~TRINITY_DN23627_c0_g1_i1.p1  ORF type:complete len:221 (-),score=39.91 TRINITY_DN23627_c0_g1_i1:125-736(-)